MNPLFKMLGASDNTLAYGKQYAFATTVLGGIPTVLSMCMPQLLRNAGHFIGAFISDKETIMMGARFLKGDALLFPS